jgi:hypothetical protein
VNAPAEPPAGTLPPELAEHPDYQILRRLGGGGMGVVYLVHNRLMGRDEVLKVIGPQIIERPEAEDRFLREIRAVARLRHPNIVSAYSAFRSGASLVFAMEYVEGLDLARMVKASGPLPVAHACHYVHQAALGLQHAHEHGMVHRDIKPGNLMLTRDRDRALIKVLDFGLAKAERENRGRDFGPVGSDRDWHAEVDSALTAAGQMLGTPGFVAPEQIDDAQSADIRADIYSLGCTLYYLLSGGLPFPAETLYDVLQAHHSMDARPLNLVRPEVPVELAALVAKMMAKDPGQRFQTPSDVAHALSPFSKKGDGASKRPGAGTPRVAPTTVDRPGAGAAFATTQPETDAEGPGARARWVWPSVAAGVLALGFGAAWVAGLLRPRAPERTQVAGPPAARPTVQEPQAPPPNGPKAPGGQAPGGSGPRVDVASSGIASPPPGVVPLRGVPTTVVPTGPNADRVDPPVPLPSPGPTPEQVLAGKGLRRSGQVYLLAETEAPITRLGAVHAQLQQLEVEYNANRDRYAAIEANYQGIDSEIAELNKQEIALTIAAAPRPSQEWAELERKEQQLLEKSFDHIKDEHERERMKRDRDQAVEAVRKRKNDLSSQQPVPLPPVDLSGLRFRRGRLESQRLEMILRGQELIVQNGTIFQSYQALQAEGLGLRDQILYRYLTLKADLEVKAALHELNKARGPGQGYVLGPAENLPSLVSALKLTAVEILLSKGLDYKKGRALRFHPRAVGEVWKGKDGVEAALRRLGDGTSPLEGLRDQVERLKAELARASSPERRTQLTALLKLKESQIDKLVRPKGPEGAGTAPDPRGELVRAVVGLRRAVDLLRASYTGLERDAEVRKALQEVGWGSKPIPAPPELSLGQKELEKVEPRIQTASVPLRKDGNRYRVDATLNGRKVASLVVDPAAEATLLPARLASAAGVTVSAAAPTENLTLDRRRVSTRGAKLRSVQVGPYTANDSPCLVLLDAGDEVVPLLGRPFLDQFGGTIDAATGTLILGVVKASASAHDPHSKEGGNVPPGPPARGTGSDRTGRTPGQDRN